MKQRFTGQMRDAETNLDYFNARYLSSHQGRFTSADLPFADQHVGDPQSWNLYPYVRNNPLRYVDPNGNIVETLWDVANLGIGAHSMADNLVKGDIEAAIWDAGGLAVDLVATVIPFVPGGAGTAIKVARAATKAEKAATAAKAVRKVDKAKDAAKAAESGQAATKPYKRPSNATTPEQRASVQGKPCVDCGATTPRMNADHKQPLVKEHYETGSIDTTRMRQTDAVQPQCPTCSSKQGADLSRYSRQQRERIKAEGAQNE